jgi:serine/threonine protein kinase
VEAARALAAELKRRWRRGAPPDAAAALIEHPDLVHHKSVVVELAYEEYLLREEAGSAPDHGAFADRFPAFRGSIRNMLDAHRLLVERPELLDPGAGAWPEVGAKFEGLELLAELGRGTFGRAYLAFDPGTDRLCALKLTTGRSAEARVIGRLAHPHVIDVYWARAIDGRTAVCMPFVGVSTLVDVISAAFPRSGASPGSASVILRAAEADGLTGQADRRSAAVVRADEPYLVGACAVAARVADAVAYLHREGIVHGDIKPSNVVIGPGGAPHLIDFNLATGGTGPTSVRGTPAYMAPELLAAATAGALVDGDAAVRADLYSLGAVIVELLTGQWNPSASPKVPAAGPGVPVLPPELPQAVVSVLASCLSADQARRPAASEVAAVLDRFVRARRRQGRSRRRVLLVGASFALIGAGIAAASVSRPEQQPDQVAEQRAPEPPPKPDPKPDPKPLPPKVPETAEELLERGRAYLRAGDANGARTDFLNAYKLSPNPHALALAAYCFALSGQHGPSIEYGLRAEKEGARTAEVYNNLGYALCQVRRLDEAIERFDTALQHSPRLQAALYNRAMARFRAAAESNPDLRAVVNLDPRAAQDIATALETGPGSAELHFDAARIFALSSLRAPAHRGSACEQIAAAIRAGKLPAGCRNDPVLKIRLGDLPEFQKACDTPPGKPPPTPKKLRLVEPRP